MGFLPCCFYFVFLGLFPGWGRPVRPFPPSGRGRLVRPLSPPALCFLFLSLFPPFGFASPPGFPGLALLGFRVGAVDSGFLLWILSRFSWCWAFGSSQVACKFVTQRSLLSKKTKLILNQRFAKVRQGLLTIPPGCAAHLYGSGAYRITAIKILIRLRPLRCRTHAAIYVVRQLDPRGDAR